MPRIIGTDEITLEGSDAELVGDSLAIAIGSLVESRLGPDAWRLQVDATTRNGRRVRVGETSVTPSAALVGRGLLRVVAGAYWPGAVAWHVRATGFRPTVVERGAGTPEAVIELFSSPGRGPVPATRSWVWAIDPDGADILDGRADPQATVTYASELVIPGRAQFLSAWGTNEGAARRWVMLFDDAGGGVADGDSPLEVAGADPGGPWRISCEEALPIVHGVSLLVSSTPGALTLDAAATCHFQKRMRAMPVA